MMETGMEQYQEWYDELEYQGFKRIREEVGNIDYQHPKKKDYIIYFDWITFKVSNKGVIVFETTQLDLGKLDEVIHAIKWPKTGTRILKSK